jgi:hypothetical protein
MTTFSAILTKLTVLLTSFTRLQLLRKKANTGTSTAMQQRLNSETLHYHCPYAHRIDIFSFEL